MVHVMQAPLWMQALLPTTDQHIYKELMKNNENNTFLKGYAHCLN